MIIEILNIKFKYKITLLKKRKDNIEDKILDNKNIIKEIIKLKVKIEYKARISPI